MTPSTMQFTGTSVDQENVEPTNGPGPDTKQEEVSTNIYNSRLSDMPREPYVRVKYDLQDDTCKSVYRTTETYTVNDIVNILPSLEQAKVYAVPLDNHVYDQWARVGKPEGANKALLRPISVSAKCCSIANAMSSSSKLGGISETSETLSLSAPARLEASERSSAERAGPGVVVADRTCHSIDDILQHYSSLFPSTIEPGTISSEPFGQGRCRTSPGSTRHQRMASTISAVLSATRSSQKSRQDQVTVPTRMASIDLPSSAQQSHLYYRTSQFWSSRHKKKASSGVPRVGIFPQTREGRPEHLPTSFEELEAKLYSTCKGKLFFKSLGLAKQGKKSAASDKQGDKPRSGSVDSVPVIAGRGGDDEALCKSAPDPSRRSSPDSKLSKAFKRRRHFSWFPQGTAAVLSPDSTLTVPDLADPEEVEGRVPSSKWSVTSSWPSSPQRYRSRPTCMDRNERHVLCLSASREDNKSAKNSTSSPSPGFSHVQFMDLNDLQTVFSHVVSQPPGPGQVQCTDNAITSGDSRSTDQVTRA